MKVVLLWSVWEIFFVPS